MFETINHCRFCQNDSTDVMLFKYSVRHYACAPCGFQRWGDAFLDKLPLAEVYRMPFMMLAKQKWTLERISEYTKARERYGDLHEVVRVFSAQRVQRTNAGGPLYAPVDQYGRESGDTPSYDVKLVQARCDELNEPRTRK